MDCGLAPSLLFLSRARAARYKPSHASFVCRCAGIERLFFINLLTLRVLCMYIARPSSFVLSTLASAIFLRNPQLATSVTYARFAEMGRTLYPFTTASITPPVPSLYLPEPTGTHRPT